MIDRRKATSCKDCDRASNAVSALMPLVMMKKHLQTPLDNFEVIEAVDFKYIVTEVNIT